MNFVIDTNVIISAVYRSPSVPKDIILYAFSNTNFVYYTKSILLEYIDVLNREKFNFNKQEVKDVIEQIKQKGILVKNIDYHFKGKMIDQDDREFYELAKSYDCLLITGNKKHYPSDPIVMTPKDFMDRLNLSA